MSDPSFGFDWTYGWCGGGGGAAVVLAAVLALAAGAAVLLAVLGLGGRD